MAIFLLPTPDQGQQIALLGPSRTVLYSEVRYVFTHMNIYAVACWYFTALCIHLGGKNRSLCEIIFNMPSEAHHWEKKPKSSHSPVCRSHLSPSCLLGTVLVCHLASTCRSIYPCFQTLFFPISLLILLLCFSVWLAGTTAPPSCRCRACGMTGWPSGWRDLPPSPISCSLCWECGWWREWVAGGSPWAASRVRRKQK